jgi:hypothetical protein
MNMAVPKGNMATSTRSYCQSFIGSPPEAHEISLSWA